MIANIDYDFAPVLDAETISSPSKWEIEKLAFQQLLMNLLTQGHRGKYVAIHEGDIVGIAEDDVALALECYRRFGYQEIFIGLIEEHLPVKKIMSPRIFRRS